MILFVINTKKEIPESVINQLFKQLFDFNEVDLDNLTGDNKHAKVRYESTKRIVNTEFNYQMIFYIPEQECLGSGIYNDLQLSLPLSDLLDDEVLIGDQSNDPSRWILVKSSSLIFIVDEILDNEREGSFELNRNSLRSVTIEKTLSVLPSEEYVKTNPEKRPIFYNQEKNWDRGSVSN